MNFDLYKILQEFGIPLFFAIFFSIIIFKVILPFLMQRLEDAEKKNEAQQQLFIETINKRDDRFLEHLNTRDKNETERDAKMTEAFNELRDVLKPLTVQALSRPARKHLQARRDKQSAK